MAQTRMTEEEYRRTYMGAPRNDVTQTQLQAAPSTSSYSNLFGTTGAGQQGSRAGISTMFGQQPRPRQEQPQQPQQTFAQLQKQGMARPAPAAPQGQPFAQFGGSQQAQQARTGMLGALQQQLAQPTRFDTQAFQQIRQAQAAQLGAEYQAEQQRLNEELARRGLSASSVGGGRMGDLAGQQARALAQLDAQLLQQAAQTQAQDRLAAMQAASQFAELAGAQDLAQFEANRVAQAAEFQQGLQAAQFGQQQTEFERGQALAAAQAQQAGGLQGMELALREALGLGELTGEFGGKQTLAAQQLAQQRTESAAERALREQLGLSEMAGVVYTRDAEGNLVPQQAGGAERQTLGARQLAEQRLAREAQVTQAQRELAQRQAEALSQQSGTVYEVNAEGQVVEKRIGGQPVRTESALARLSQQQLQQAELTGSYTNPDGTKVSTLAAQRLSQENLRALADQAAQRSQLTGQMHRVDENGNVVLDTDARGNPVSTESRRAQMVQEGNTARQQSMQQAEARSQQTGLSFIVNDKGDVVADIDPATMQQRTTAQARQFQAQLDQQKTLAVAEMTGTIRIGDRDVSTIAAQRLGQEGIQLALQQAAQLSQQTGNIYEVNAEGQVVPKTGADGAPIRTESALARLSAEKLQQAELTGKYTDANGVTIDTIAAKQFDQNRLNALADQAARQSQLTGNMYTVNAQGQVVQELGANGQPVSTEARRAQVQQEANVARQIAQARADALSQQSGLSYTVNADNEVVPDNDPETGAQRTTVQAQQLAAQTEQARLDRELRSRLGLGELTGTIDGQQTLGAQQQAFNQQQQQNQLFIQLAGILAQSGSTGTAGFLNQLMSALGVPNANIGGGAGGGSSDREAERMRGRTSGQTGTGTTTTTGGTTTGGAGRGTGVR